MRKSRMPLSWHRGAQLLARSVAVGEPNESEYDSSIPSCGAPDAGSLTVICSSSSGSGGGSGGGGGGGGGGGPLASL